MSLPSRRRAIARLITTAIAGSAAFYQLPVSSPDSMGVSPSQLNMLESAKLRLSAAGALLRLPLLAQEDRADFLTASPSLLRYLWSTRNLPALAGLMRHAGLSGQLAVLRGAGSVNDMRAIGSSWDDDTLSLLLKWWSCQSVRLIDLLGDEHDSWVEQLWVALVERAASAVHQGTESPRRSDESLEMVDDIAENGSLGKIVRRLLAGMRKECENMQILRFLGVECDLYGKALISVLNSQPLLVLSPTDLEICFKYLRRDLFDKILAIHVSRKGQFGIGLILSLMKEEQVVDFFVTGDDWPTPLEEGSPILCPECMPKLVDSVELLRQAVLLCERSLGVLDREMFDQSSFITTMDFWHTLEGHPGAVDDTSLSDLGVCDLLTRLELLTDMLASRQKSQPLKKVSEKLARFVLPVLLGDLEIPNAVKVAANIAALGGLDYRMKEIHLSRPLRQGDQFELARLAWNISRAFLPSAGLLRDGLTPMSLESSAAEDGQSLLIVCVHGLTGDSGSWRLEGGGLWPGELLEKKIPGSQALSFSFDAPLLHWAGRRGVYLEAATPARIRGIADRLLEVLDTRGVFNEESVRVLFLCHSMGGLVVKSALTRSSGLRDRTAGCVFFGTPHLGSPIADLATGVLVPEFVVELSSKHPQLNRINEEYLALKLPTLCVVEKVPIDIGRGWQHLVVSEQSASAAGGDILQVDVDHFQICKVYDQHDPRYKAILKLLGISNYKQTN